MSLSSLSRPSTNVVLPLSPSLPSLVVLNEGIPLKPKGSESSGASPLRMSFDITTRILEDLLGKVPSLINLFSSSESTSNDRLIF